MKPESIKAILRSYLENKQPSSPFDDIDGIGVDAPEYVPGDNYDAFEGRPDDLLYMQAGAANLPLHELDVQLPSNLERIATGIGRQLSEMSDEFESDHADASRSRSNSENESRSVQFKESIIHVPPTCDHVQIPLIRTRASDNVVNVTWRTCDKSAKEGLHYIKNEGSISFDEDDEEKIIEVQIVRDLDRRSDIHFSIELYDDGGTFNTLLIYIQDESKLYPEEKQVIENIFNCGRNISVSEIVTCLRDNVTHKTFKAGLLCLSSLADSMPTKELALGFELVRLTAHTGCARFSLLTGVLCDFFSYLPDLENIAQSLNLE